MWIDFLKGTLGLLVVLGAWVALQAFVRKQSACGADTDTLEHMAHGCAGCNGGKACRNMQSHEHQGSLEKEEHHELV